MENLFVITFFSGYCLNVFKLVRFLGGRYVICQVLTFCGFCFFFFSRILFDITCPCTASLLKSIMKPQGRALGGCSILRVAKVEKHQGEELPPWTTAANLQKSEVRHPGRSLLSSLHQNPLLTVLAPNFLSGLGAHPQEAMRTLMCGTPSGLEPVPMQAPLVPGFLLS